MRNKLISLCLIAWILTALPLTAAAREFDPDQRGSISVTLVSPTEQEPMVGAELAVYYVATVQVNGEGNLSYVASGAFDHEGISLEDPELVTKLDAFVSGGDIPFRKIVTDAEGKAICTDLPLGLYFVKQTGTVEGFAPCASFLVTLPIRTDSGFCYDVDASPKTDIARLVSITVRKVWNTDKSTAIPGSVTVQLLRNDEVIETAVLDEENHWQVTYENLPESDAYCIKEVHVPKGFTATYTQKGYVFTVTNTSSLAQTGQLVWPIPVLAMAGLFFLVLGFTILRKSEKNDA